VYKGLTLTTTNPAFQAPKQTIGYCKRFGSITANLSFYLRPLSYKNAAKAVDYLSTSS